MTTKVPPIMTSAGKYMGQYARLSYTTSNNTNAGTTSTGWSTYPLNTEDVDADSIVSLSGSDFILSAGTYYISASTFLWYSTGSAIRIYNVTDATTEIRGHNIYVGSQEGTPTLGGQITLTTTKTLRLQYRVTTAKSTDGFGVVTNWGENEIWGVVEIFKVA